MPTSPSAAAGYSSGHFAIRLLGLVLNNSTRRVNRTPVNAVMVTSPYGKSLLNR